MIRKLATYIVLAGALSLFCGGHSLANSAGPGSGELGYVAGLQNPEDVLRVGEGKWLLVSGLVSWTPDPASRGHIYLVDSEARSVETLFPGRDPVFRHDRRMFPDCPGPIDPEGFSAHGLALKAVSPGRFRMYMTSHGKREAIEVFDVDARAGKPAIAWVGCVPVPKTMWLNSIVILGDGGFLTTKSKDATNLQAFDHLVERRLTGAVYEWHPGGRLTQIAGTDLSGPNGIAVSPDDRWLYVTAMGSHEVVRFDRNAPDLARKVVSIPVYPDNIHWGDDGMLYTVGRDYVARPDGKNCPRLNCGTGWSIVRIHPQTLAVERVGGADPDAPLQAASSVIRVGDQFWIGNFDGDRIGYMKAVR